MSRDSDKQRYLVALHNWQKDRPGEIPNLLELFGEDLEGSDGYWRSILGSLVEAGLMRDASGMGGLDAIAGYLTPRGDEYIESLEKVQLDPAQRRRAAVVGVLKWLDHQDRNGVPWSRIVDAVGAILLEGTALSEIELQNAARRLADDGLIEARTLAAEATGPGLARIKADGRRCIDSGLEVDEWLERRKDREQIVNNYHFTGAFPGASVVAGSRDFTITISPSGTPSDDVRVLMDAVLESIDRLGLSSNQAADVTRGAEEVRGEVQRAGRDERLVKQMLTEVGQGIKAGTKTATATTILFGINLCLVKMGIPPVS